jgi:quinol monooxygenase YgiN
MITRIVKLEIHPDHALGFRQLFHEKQADIAASTGCHEVRLVHTLDNSSTHFTISIWDSEDDLNAYRYSDLFAEIWPTVKPWFIEKAVAWTTVSF